MHSNLRRSLRTALGIAGVVLAANAAAQVTFFENDGFRGRQFNATGDIVDFQRYGFNDRASSAIVDNGRWEVCTDARFSGRCVVLRPGRYESLAQLGLDNRASSVRAVNRSARNYNSQGAYVAGDAGYRRGKGERVFQAQVTSVHAVVGPPEQRCWVERQQVSNGGANVPGAIAGAVIGGILGHQIGGGRGQDLATAGGAVGGAALGANVGGGSSYSRDVQRCASTPRSSRPDYWDVTYNFHGAEHRVQMTSPPGATIAVNANGEPRI
jgi:uncharacterized protein YcfJ